MRAVGLAVLAFASALIALPPAGASSGPCKPQPASAVPPPLTSPQCVSTSRIVANDPYLHALLHGVKYTVGRPDPWGGDKGNIGAVIRIQLAKPLDVARTVIPVASFPSDQSDNYSTGHESVSIHGATSLDVFVGFKERRVVWVIPMPAESEGPPPTSIPPDTPPKGFAVGTGGVSAQDAAQGLVVRVVTFDSTGRLVQQEWFDPLTGDALTELYNPERKVTVRFVSVASDHATRVTTITDSAHTWTAGRGPVGTTTSGVTALDSRSLPARIQRLMSDGHEQIRGADALRFKGALGLFYWGLGFQVGSGEVWADPATGLPIQQTLTNGRTGAVEEKMLFSWLPRSAATAAASTAAVPAGYKHMPSTGLPHIFGD